ncbi:hypothetical protein [Pseudoalteromonas sp. MIP2626]|uniref:hypothetical protein n=1 Tax=Alteromonadales TaxID=135622 RepID=UPI0015CA0E62|nr:hypothetical protein [Pseudoalteromonas sp. MIP2626]NYR14219.1 hypothetical protein [Pseudoalteromonas sp. MIP2626]
MTNNILVPDYSLQPSGYKPLFLHNPMVLIIYLCSQRISPFFYHDAINELKNTQGMLTQNIINYLQDKTSRSVFPTAPLGYFDEQRHFISYVTTHIVGTPQTQDYEPEFTY